MKKNSNSKLTHNNFGMESLGMDSIAKLFTIGFVKNKEKFNSELVHCNFGMESTEGNSIVESFLTNSIKDNGVVIHGCYFIELVKLMLKEGQKGFIHKLVLLTGAKFSVPPEDLSIIKGRTVHSVSFFSFAHCFLQKFTLIFYNHERKHQ
jgi:hypothetical protein